MRPAAPGPEAPAGSLATALDGEAPLRARMDALRSQPETLNRAAQDRLRALVNDFRADPTLRNDALNALERQRFKLRDLGADLIRMWADESENAIWRDYTLQHMERVWDFSDDRAALVETLFAAAGTPSGDGRTPNYSGTALLSLERLSKRHPRITRRLEQAARRTLSDPGKDPEKTVTALQVARARGDRNALPEARRIAGDAQALARARMSAVGTIGELGGAEDLALLDRLTGDPESRVARVARYQLGRLRRRLGEDAHD